MSGASTDGDEPVSARTARVWRLTVAMTALAALGAIPLIGAAPISGGIGVPWWALVVAFVVTEVLVVHFPFRSNSVAFTMTEVPITISFGAVSPITGTLARLAGSLIGLTSQRVRGVKLGFNLASAALETVAATHVYRFVVADGSPLDPRGWSAAIASALVVDLLSAASITAAMSLMEGRFELAAIRDTLLSSTAAAITNSCLAIITLIVIDHNAWGGIALAVVAAVVLVAYRAWATQTGRYRNMETLYEFYRSVELAADVPEVVGVALVHARELTAATHVELVSFGGRHHHTRWTVDPDSGAVRSESVRHGAGWWADVTNDPLLVAAPAKRETPHPILARLGCDSVLVVPIRSARGTHGFILAADREDDVSAFNDEDLRLFATLGSQLAIEFDNSALLDRLRTEASQAAHVARHDALTGLPNRRWLSDHIGAQLAAGRPVAVGMLDLDRFKDINDTLGHAAGDSVLTAVAARLSGAIGDRGRVARFGGDEFAIVFDADRPDTVEALATALHEALEAPISIDHLAVDVAGSIGVAIAPDHGSDPDTLLQHADVAMYVAKDRQSGFEFYAFDRDVNDVRRLSLVSELRSTIADGGLGVFYQPQIDLRTGAICGVEALARWTSPTFGSVPPDEFVPLAECTGLISPLTDFVIATALGDCATWRASGWDGNVSVNLSPRSLLDADLPSRIEQHLAATALPASALTLELTETSIMRDPERNIEILTRLQQIGIELAIDVFGTGYSSLSYLKRLPVAEIKVDRTFIANLDWDDDDRTIVRATIRLAHDLGLRIVAEGVETKTAQALLETWGADVAQGYFFGRAVPRDAFSARLRSGLSPHVLVA